MSAVLGRAAIALLAFLLWFGPLELGARWWTSRRGDPLDKASAVLRMDAELGWRQKEDWKGTFLGLPLRTDALGLRNPEGAGPRTGARVVVLGPSSTFGWGVREEETYSRVLERLLRAESKDASVVNAGEIGYSSWQGLEFYRRNFKGTRPDLLVIAYGVNDVDRHRFFFADQQPDAEALSRERSAAAVAVLNAAGRLRMLHLARRKGLLLLGRLGCALGAKPPADPVGGLRVSEGEFQSNLATIIAQARAEGSRVLLVTSPFLLPELPRAAPSARQEALRSHAAGLARYRGGDFAGARGLFEEALRLDPGRPDTAYHLSACHRALRDCAKERDSFEAARGLEPGRLSADIRRYNEAMRRLARSEKVPFVDAEKLLEGADKRLFVDPIHPTAEGHRRIADALHEAITRARML